jgi:aminopeptidase N
LGIGAEVSGSGIDPAGIGRITDSLPRALCWAAMWDMTRDAELAASDFVALVLSDIGAETDIGIVESLHRNLRTAVEQYVAPHQRDGVWASVSAAARAHLDRAVPGSDAQLAWARLFTRMAASNEDLATVAGLRDGNIAIDGLTIDTDLRWTLVTALARNGRLDADGIAAERDADPTTAGAEYAAGALAARPTAEAKAEAWAAVIERDDLPNGTQDAIIGVGRDNSGVGFAQASQEELLRPYAERYFAAITDVWANRPMEIARAIVTGLYPRFVVSAETVRRTDEFLADETTAPALRRLVMEGRDDVVRALRAQSV